MAITRKRKNAAASRSSASGNSASRAAIDRPFDPALLAKAAAVVARYRVILGIDDEAGEYYGRGLELPGAMGDGKTPDKCVASTREAMRAIAAFMLERGERLPSPASDASRPVQLNIRVSAEEKLLFEEAARQRGQGLSDFVRSAALAGVARP
jgi:predicted RNase H-like HicB family nuclease